MKKVIGSFIALIIVAWFGVRWLIDEATSEYVETEIAGGYYFQALTDDYAEIYNEKTAFSIPQRVVWYGSDASFIVVIRKQQSNLEYQFGPCEYYAIDHVKAVEYSMLTEKDARDLLRYQTELYGSFTNQIGKRCNVTSDL